MTWLSRARHEYLLDEMMRGKVAEAERALYERMWEEEKAAHAFTRAGARADVKALQDELRDLRQQKLADERRWAEEARGFTEAPPASEDAEDTAEDVDPVKAVLDRIDQIHNGGPDKDTLWFEEPGQLEKFVNVDSEALRGRTDATEHVRSTGEA